MIPSAADDPFGAMNAMASYGTSQRAPEIVIVNDGKPVEQVSTGNRLIGVAKYAVPALVALIIGWVASSVHKDSTIAAESQSHASAISKLLDADMKQLGPLKSAFETSGGEKKDLDDLSTTLAAAKDKLTANKATVLKLKSDGISPDQRAAIGSFYSQLEEINDLITDHQSTASMEEAANKVGADQLAKLAVKDSDTIAKVGYHYKLGVVMTNPTDDTDKDPRALRLVEIGAPLCGQTPDLKAASPSDTGSCPANTGFAGFLYRFDGGDPGWLKGKVLDPSSLKAGEAFPLDQIVLINDDPTLTSLVKTPDSTYAEAAYTKRLLAIQGKVKAAYAFGETLQKALNSGGK